MYTVVIWRYSSAYQESAEKLDDLRWCFMDTGDFYAEKLLKDGEVIAEFEGLPLSASDDNLMLQLQLAADEFDENDWEKLIEKIESKGE